MSEAPLLIHCGVSDSQRHHGHTVHVVRHALRFLHVPVNPAGPRDPLQVTSTTATHNSSNKACGELFKQITIGNVQDMRVNHTVLNPGKIYGP